MFRLLSRFWREEGGAIISTEMVTIMTVAGLAMTAGLAKLSHAVDAEFDDLACAVRALDQSYEYSGLSGCTSCWSGSSYNNCVERSGGSSLYWCDEDAACVDFEPACLEDDARLHAKEGAHKHDAEVKNSGK